MSADIGLDISRHCERDQRSLAELNRRPCT